MAVLMTININAWPAGRLQDVLSLLRQAEQADMTIAGLRAAIEEHLRAEYSRYAGAGQVKAAAGNRGGKPGRVPCSRPGCGGTVRLFPVNISKCTAVGGPWRTQAICRRCGNDQLSELTVEAIIKRGRV